jgi:putative ABC transport system permease protein
VLGISGRLARENAVRNPKRTASTASALMIGVGLVGFITIFAASAKASFADIVDDNFDSEIMITGPAAFGMGGLDPALADAVRARPEVGTVGAIRAGFAEIDGDPTQILAADAGAFALVDVRPLQGRPADLVEGTIAVYEETARKHGLQIGDQVPVIFRDSGLQQLRVAMIYGELHPADNWLLGMATYNANFADHFDFQLFVAAADGVPVDDALRAVEAVTDSFPGAQAFDAAGYKADQTKMMDQLLGIIYALLALAVLIALLGIGNTLALSIMERRREVGLMRAVGMGRAQVRRTVRWESVIIALQGTLLGLGVGVLFGWALVRALGDEGLGHFTLPVTRLAVIVLLGALAGVAAAVLPARRAARLDILRAIASE